MSFNPRSPVGSDTVKLYYNDGGTLFQSTLPVYLLRSEFREVQKIISAVGIHLQRSVNLSGRILPGLAIVLPPQYFDNCHTAFWAAQRGVILRASAEPL